MISAHCPNIPVLEIYAFDVNALNPFATQEFIDGEPWSTIWGHYTQMEKGLVMVEIHISSIGGFASCVGGFASGTHWTLGPTVEGSKLFKGWLSFGPLCQ